MLPPLSLTVRQDAIDVFAQILEDPDPIHLNPAAAAAARLGERTINQGPGGELLSEQDGRLECSAWLDVEDGARAIEGTATVVPGEE